MPAAFAKSPLVLVIRDGWGENPHREHDPFNAIKLAKTPVDHDLAANWPRTLVRTSGEDVGLPRGTMGNSEVGHQNIGAGRIVDQELMRITRAVRDGSFLRNEALRGAVDHVKRTNGNLHLLGLLSDGRVHSDIEHLLALLNLVKHENLPGRRVFIHAITDGRDVGPKTALKYLDQLEETMEAMGVGRVTSVCGRFYAMDRDHRWERTAAAYRLLTGRAVAHQKFNESVLADADSPRAAVKRYYDNPSDPSRTGDEFVVPTRIDTGGIDGGERTIANGDAVIFFNFRGDRPRQLTRSFVLSDNEWRKVQGGGFDRGQKIQELYFCTMTGYEAGLPVSAIAFEKPPKMKNILGEVIANEGRTQFRCAETEKFAHVTFFFNDYREDPFPGERRMLVPSPQDVSTYDQKPEMSALGVCDVVIERLTSDDCEDLIVVNFANLDMVGHSGRLDAVVRAVEVVDECVGRIVKATLSRGGSLIVTADHGNAEQMYDLEHNSPHTAHTTFDVPLYVVGEAFRNAQLRETGRLADVAPTALMMLGITKPPEMSGESLLS